MKKSARIQQLELEVESYRQTAEKLADELESILAPHRNKNPEATVDDIIKLASRRHACGFGSKEVH